MSHESSPGCSEKDGSDPAVAAAEAVRRLIVLLVSADLPASEAAILATELGRLADNMGGHSGLSRFRPDPVTGEVPSRGSPKVAITNAVTGLVNPLAPPMHIETRHGVASGSGVFGPQYEGAPGCVHGGFLAAVLESLLPRPAAHLGLPNLTGTLTIKYRHPTPIGVLVDLRAELQSVEGRKIRTFGSIAVEGKVCVEAEAVLIALKPDTAEA